MLSAKENDLLTRVGPGTPMGDLYRRFWLPVLLSDELPEPDCTPVRFMVLGERLVAFRDTAGRVGVLDERCPHRLASLFWGRNEEGGLRCVYHGWKWDIEGRCLDLPNTQEGESYKDKVAAFAAYPAVERGGLAVIADTVEKLRPGRIVVGDLFQLPFEFEPGGHRVNPDTLARHARHEDVGAMLVLDDRAKRRGDFEPALVVDPGRSTAPKAF